MKSLRHRLPPLVSLMTFESAARTLNFTRAAEELHVSQAAVSKQIRLLEAYLNVLLFHRHGRRVELTSQGRYLYAKITSSMNFMADAIEEVRSVNEARSVTIAANNAVNHYWLGRVIEEFRKQNTDFHSSIRFISSDRTSDFFSDDVDMAVVYDPPAIGSWAKELLFEEELFPVASPEYLISHPPHGGGPEQLLNHALLDYERVEPNWIDWSLWLQAVGVDSRKLRPASYANSYLSLVSAAEHSQGLTLGTRYLLDEQIALGRLVRFSGFSYRTGNGYYILHDEAKVMSVGAQQLYDWIVNYLEFVDLRNHQSQ